MDSPEEVRLLCSVLGVDLFPDRAGAVGSLVCCKPVGAELVGLAKYTVQSAIHAEYNLTQFCPGIIQTREIFPAVFCSGYYIFIYCKFFIHLLQ